MSSLKNIAVAGAAGNAGRHIVDALIASGKFVVTAISRDESDSTFPADVKVQKGHYDSTEFLTSALQGQDVLIIVLGGRVPKDLQSRLIKAAALAEVPWVLPCEFGPDTGNPTIANSLPVFEEKKKYRDEIEALGKSSWIAVITGIWFTFGLAWPYFGGNVKERTFKYYDDGTTKASTSTLSQVGRGVAKLLELPAATLEQYKNNFVYIQSFHITQQEIFQGLQNSTGTTEQDWEITKIPVDKAIANGREEIKKGNFMGAADVMVGMTFKEGMGGYYKEKSANDTLGLEEENLMEVLGDFVKNELS